MRGKKADPVFVAQFIQDSVQSGFETPDQIIKYAKQLINQIDADIREIEVKKIKRSKLLDVIASFEEVKKNKTGDAKLLPFFEISHPEVAKHICSSLKGSKFYVDPKMYSGVVQPEWVYTTKQLLECEVLMREDVYVKPGPRFDEYMTFVLHEAK